MQQVRPYAEKGDIHAATLEGAGALGWGFLGRLAQGMRRIS